MPWSIPSSLQLNMIYPFEAGMMNVRLPVEMCSSWYPWQTFLIGHSTLSCWAPCSLRILLAVEGTSSWSEWYARWSLFARILWSSLLAVILCHSRGLLLQLFLCRFFQPISMSYSLNTKSAFVVISDPLCVLTEAPLRLGPGPHALCPAQHHVQCLAHCGCSATVWPCWLITCLETLGDPCDGGSVLEWWLWQGLDWSLFWAPVGVCRRPCN